MGEPGSDFTLDRQTVMWRVGFLFYGYLLLWALVLCPWLIIMCRSRYNVLHKDWTCRGCKACYRGKRARKRVCDECGKRRHFVNRAPLLLAAVCAPLALYGGALVFFGGLLHKFRGRLDTDRLVRFKDISVAKDYQMSEKTDIEGNKFVTDIPMKLTMEYIELYVELPIRIDPLTFEITYENEDEGYKAQIGIFCRSLLFFSSRAYSGAQARSTSRSSASTRATS